MAGYCKREHNGPGNFRGGYRFSMSIGGFVRQANRRKLSIFFVGYRKRKMVKLLVTENGRWLESLQDFALRGI